MATSALIIILRLGFKNIIDIWPIDSTKNPSLSLLKPIDYALNTLCCDINVERSSIPNEVQIRLNGLNFIYEFMKYDIVRNALENNKDYSIMFLFRMNQFLVENDFISFMTKFDANELKQMPAPNFSIKVFFQF